MVGSFLVHRVQIGRVRREVKRRLEKDVPMDELTLFSFAKNQLSQIRWVKPNREFSYLGEMYDVVQADTVGDSIHYRCWWDNEETKLNKKLAQLVDTALDNNPTTENNQKQYQSFCKSLFRSRLPSFSIVLDMNTVLYDEIKSHYDDIPSAPISPPPEVT
jgi:hypothetical protein